MTRPLRVLVVSRWYPAVDDVARGAFVADQVAALAATGQLDLRVASFEFCRITRLADRQEAERAAIHRRYAASLVRADAATDGAWPSRFAAWTATAAVPVARLPVASGPDDEPWREGDEHEAALAALAAGEAAWNGAFDLVHAHTGFPDGVAGAAVAREAGVPYVVTEHASRTRELLGDPEVRRRYVEALRGAARVVAVSDALAAELRAALPELDAVLAERLTVVPNAVPVDLFSAPPVAARRRGELLYVGTRKPDKGIATLLAAFARVHAERPETALRLVGRAPTPDDEQRWQESAAELGIGDAVAFDPPADRSGVAAAMARADVFVHPSRYETFGVVAVEALASGLPVVATQSGGVDEIVGPEAARLGLVGPVGDAEAMARNILAVLDHREAFDPAQLRASAASRFAAPAVAARLLDLYGEAAPEATRTPRETEEAPNPAGTDRDAPSVPALVVGLNRVRASRALEPLPPGLRERLTLLTVPDPGDQPLPDGIGRVVELDLDEDFRAAVEKARNSHGIMYRALGRPDPHRFEKVAALNEQRLDFKRETARRRIVDEAQALERAAAGAPPDVLCLDGADVMAAEPALDANLVRLAPGSSRWLADRWREHARDAT